MSAHLSASGPPRRIGGWIATWLGNLSVELCRIGRLVFGGGSTSGHSRASAEGFRLQWHAVAQGNGYCDGRSRSISSEQISEHGDVIGACWVGPDVKNHVIVFLGDLPGGERAALSLGGDERLELLMDAGFRPVADFKQMTAASSAGTALCRQSLPSLHPCGAVIRAQRARNGQRDDLWAVSALHRYMVPDDYLVGVLGRRSRVQRFFWACSRCSGSALVGDRVAQIAQRTRAGVKHRADCRWLRATG
jgi:hypothetical protein